MWSKHHRSAPGSTQLFPFKEHSSKKPKGFTKEVAVSVKDLSVSQQTYSKPFELVLSLVRKVISKTWTGKIKPTQG